MYTIFTFSLLSLEYLSSYQKFVLAGYAVAQGKFDGKDLRFVSGAPRQNVKDKAGKDQGQVAVYNFLKEPQTLADGGLRTDRLKYDEDLFLKGDKSFSGFGTSLLVVDINNDM